MCTAQPDKPSSGLDSHGRQLPRIARQRPLNQHPGRDRENNARKPCKKFRSDTRSIVPSKRPRDQTSHANAATYHSESCLRTQRWRTEARDQFKYMDSRRLNVNRCLSCTSQRSSASMTILHSGLDRFTGQIPYTTSYRRHPEDESDHVVREGIAEHRAFVRLHIFLSRSTRPAMLRP